ncbi:MAG: hypothetical protein LBK73_01070 [Treponema sp.]|nr:hypothetical protein [Treponema sp.]
MGDYNGYAIVWRTALSTPDKRRDSAASHILGNQRRGESFNGWYRAVMEQAAHSFLTSLYTFNIV